MCTSVILYYDYALTFSREVEFFWAHENRTGWVSSLYFLNRYVAIFGYIPVVFRLLPGSDSLFRVRVLLTLLTFSRSYLVTLSRNTACQYLSSIHWPSQLTCPLVAKKCISTSDIWGWSCNSLLHVSLPSISSETLTNSCSPLCDTRIRVV